MTVGVNNLDALNQYKLYPNPANEGFYFESINTLSKDNLKIIDGLGKTMQAPIQEVSVSKLYINTTTLPVGIYQLVYKSKTEEKTFKISVIR